MIKIGILIPVFNHLSYTKECLKNLDKALTAEKLTKNFEIIVIDDGSTDGTGEWVKKNYPKVHLLNGDGNLWWSGGINMGARYAVDTIKCSHVLLWNNDIAIEPVYFNTMVSILNEYDENTIIGSKVYADEQKTLVWSMGGWYQPFTGRYAMKAYMKPDEEEFRYAQQADWLTGMGTIVPAHIMQTIGYWDELNFPQYHGDMEFTYRATKKGFKNIVDPRLHICNDITNTGLNHGGSFKKLLRLLSDKRSLYYFRMHVAFINKYSKSPLAYIRMLKEYLKLFLGFFKWKTLEIIKPGHRSS